jgi:hypothetical protein
MTRRRSVSRSTGQRYWQKHSKPRAPLGNCTRRSNIWRADGVLLYSLTSVMIAWGHTSLLMLIAVVVLAAIAFACTSLVVRSRQDRGFRYQVAVPVGGLGAMVADMHGFCHSRGLRYRPRMELRSEPVTADYTIWCFADPTHADVFQSRFGGERITVTE